MISLSDLYDGLERVQSLRNCGDCSIDCPYYISGSYGRECALDVVMSQVSLDIADGKDNMLCLDEEKKTNG